ncbi:branched-chain amino acid ABC transporter permease [Castellaniella sp. MT123]|uniref:branched-chain amino acid ABC transporter permease n=1 Tax=Castellaniella sp. MT123 TaxID=3140381 RepID=UPI0031F42CD3
MLAYAILAGILFGLYFSLVGLGLNLVFGVMRIVNLAHGDFVMLGALLAGALYGAYAISPVLAAVISLIVFIIIGFPLYYLLVPRLLQAPDPEMLSIILFFGFSQVIESVTTIVAGPSERSIPGRAMGTQPVHILGQTFPAAWVWSAVASAIAVLLVFLYLYRTRVGRLTRAVMADRHEALASGIDVGRISGLAFGIGLGLAAVAGAFAPFMLGGISPASGVSLTIQSFTVIIVGSLGSPLGTVLGGLIYGISIMLMQTYLSSWAALLPYLLLIAILLVRPSGLLGHEVRHA